MQSGAIYQGYDELEARILSLLREDCPSDGEFNALALDVFSFQVFHNQPLGNFARRRNLKTPAHWTEIPAVPTDAFKLENFPMRSFLMDETSAVFHTSGTTGESRGRHFFKSLSLYRASVVEGWRRFAASAGIGDLPMLVLTHSPEQAPHSSLSAMMASLGGEFFINANNAIDLDSLREALTAGQPVILMGTALALLHLAETSSLPLPEGSWLMETGGYKGTDLTWTKEELYEKFSQAFRLPASRMINEYSMTELSSQFYTTDLAGCHGGPPWIRARVVDPATGVEVEPGSAGCLEFCDLANLGSTLAVRTEDVAIRRENGTFQLIGRDPKAIPRGCSRSADEMLCPPPTSIFQSFDFHKNASPNR